jgi:hypothetical protein
LTTSAMRSDPTNATTRCAARLCPPPSNRQVVIWQSAAGRLNGVFLNGVNGLHSFQIIVPATVDPSAHQLKYVRADPYTLALAARTLYLETPGGALWAAGLPRPDDARRLSPSWKRHSLSK